MGEAKRRGSFEERKAAAIERNKITEAAREKARLDRWNRMTKKQREATMMMASLQALADEGNSL